MKTRETHLFIHLIFLFCSAAAILPMLLVVAISLSSESSVNKYGYSLIPHEFSLDAYRYIFSNSYIVLRAYFVTIFVTVTGTLACLIITSALAYPISRKSLPYRKFFTFFIVITILFNGGLVPWYILYKNYLHLSDNMLALIIPGLLLNGFNVLIMRTFFTNTIPPELFEVANIDGAGELRIFVQIVITPMPYLQYCRIYSEYLYPQALWNSYPLQVPAEEVTEFLPPLFRKGCRYQAAYLYQAEVPLL